MLFSFLEKHFHKQRASPSKKGNGKLLGIFSTTPSNEGFFNSILVKLIFYYRQFGLGGLGVTCSPRDQRFAGSNPAEVDGFFQDVKILSTSPRGGTLSQGSRV